MLEASRREEEDEELEGVAALQSSMIGSVAKRAGKKAHTERVQKALSIGWSSA